MTLRIYRYAVNLEQSIVEIAAIFGTDWIQIWNMNDAKSPDYRKFADVTHMHAHTPISRENDVHKRPHTGRHAANLCIQMHIYALAQSNILS